MNTNMPTAMNAMKNMYANRFWLKTLIIAEISIVVVSVPLSPHNITIRVVGRCQQDEQREERVVEGAVFVIEYLMGMWNINVMVRVPQ